MTIVNTETGKAPRAPGSDPAVYMLIGDADRTLYIGATRDVAKAQLVREACLDAHHVDLAARKERAS